MTTHFDWNDRYNIWSGLIGGMFLALAYFGCDQSQVQRYLTGKSIAQSRLSLLFNAVAKIPMQFFILFIGAMVFVFFTFEKPPLLFQPVELARLAKDPRFPAVEQRYDQAFAQRKQAAEDYLAGAAIRQAQQDYPHPAIRTPQRELDGAHAAGEQLVAKDFHDTNYIFLSFVTHYLPVGVVGLIIAVIFTAAMSSTSGEINSLAAVTVIDLYQRHVRKDASDRHYLMASRIATVFWGAYAVVFAQYGSNFGALIEAVNIIGSLFYGGLLGVFVLAFFFKSVGANGAFFGVLAGEAAIFAAYLFTKISFLWYNVIGCVVVIVVAVLVSRFLTTRGSGGVSSMINFKTILYPVDLSAQSRAVAPSVAAMAKRFGSEVVLLHVTHASTPDRTAQAKLELDRFAGEAFPNPVVREVAEGDPARQIVSYADQHKVDLIMMPTHGHGPFRALLLGSVTAKVLHDTHCLVWTGVHAEELTAHSPDRWKRVLCAVETDEHGESVLKWASEFARQQNLELQLVHAVAGADGMWTEAARPEHVRIPVSTPRASGSLNCRPRREPTSRSA